MQHIFNTLTLVILGLQNFPEPLAPTTEPVHIEAHRERFWSGSDYRGNSDLDVCQNIFGKSA